MSGVAITAGVAAGAVTAAVTVAHRAGVLPGGSQRWARTNHAGDPVTLTEGVALTVGAGLPLLVCDPPGALTALGAGAVGALDDLAGGAQAKGLGGHLRALVKGQVTTGVVKIAVLGTTGLLACAWHDARTGRGLGADTLAGAALVAGSANLANLFDLRPGRALKVALLAAAPGALAGNPTAAATTGAALTALPDDLRGTSMLGDTGANPLGALVGLAAAQQLGPRGRWVALAAVSALVVVSEKVSFTAVIDGTPALRWLDRWGRADR